jgi:hypothetical protein
MPASSQTTPNSTKRTADLDLASGLLAGAQTKAPLAAPSGALRSD